jgi:type I restriction enzyme S subunit
MKTEYITKTKDAISEEAIKGSSTNLVDNGSILIVVRSGILQHTLPVAIAANELTINQDMKALTLSEKYYSKYIYHYLTGNNHKVLRATLKAGNTVESIDFAEFSKYKIPYPPLIEQKEIGDAVESIAINIRNKEQILKVYKNTKKALMQDLLTGKVRVNTESTNTEVAVG